MRKISEVCAQIETAVYNVDTCTYEVCEGVRVARRPDTHDGIVVVTASDDKHVVTIAHKNGDTLYIGGARKDEYKAIAEYMTTRHGWEVARI